ncbi:hypothetical protein CPC08DRAFT_705425 [Agrocybe pediades]|nr:hypothetical protein CPC08DRAFT_705425 [Agrocybe pediades]
MATVISHNHASADAVSIIDSKIKQHKQEILALMTQRNTYAPISRLPPELITLIFDWYKKVESISTKFQYSQPLRWTRCTHVCRLWRTIALNSPTLWTDIDLNHLNWAKEALVRSRMAALKISFQLMGFPGDNSTTELAKDIIRQGSRLKDLSIRSHRPARGKIEEILRSFPRSTPNLQSLEITHVSRSTKIICLPSDRLCDAEKLQRLSITGCGIDWVHHILNKKTLTVLKLVNITSTSTISMPQFLQSLGDMRSIQTLELKNAFSILVPHHTSMQSQRIALPSLRVLRLGECPAEILGFFFKHIALGKGVSMEIKSQGTDESCFMTFLEEISSVLSSNGTDLALCSLRIIKATLTELSMDGFLHQPVEVVDGETNALVQDRDRTPFFGLALTISSVSSTQQGALWINACATLPLTRVKSVCWSCEPCIPVEAINSCFGTLPNLDSLTFSCEYSKVYELLLATLPSSEGTCSTFTFPELRILTLRDFTLSGNSLAQLIDLLIQRYEGGLEVEKLVIRGCYEVEDEEIDLLCEVVTDVEWDEMVLASDSDELTDEGHYATFY